MTKFKERGPSTITNHREDLGLTNSVVRCAQHPNNVWALHGLVECLTIRGERGEKEELAKFKTLLNSAIAKADVAVMSSCCCREQVRDLPGSFGFVGGDSAL